MRLPLDPIASMLILSATVLGLWKFAPSGPTHDVKEEATEAQAPTDAEIDSKVLEEIAGSPSCEIADAIQANVPDQKADDHTRFASKATLDKATDVKTATQTENVEEPSGSGAAEPPVPTKEELPEAIKTGFLDANASLGQAETSSSQPHNPFVGGENVEIIIEGRPRRYIDAIFIEQGESLFQRIDLKEDRRKHTTRLPEDYIEIKGRAEYIQLTNEGRALVLQELGKGYATIVVGEEGIKGYEKPDSTTHREQ